MQVSYNRPYGKYCQIFDAPLSTGSGEFFLWEFPLAFWMESQGYDVTYISNLDTHADPAGLRRAKGFLSVGHDEYWTIEMFRQCRGRRAERRHPRRSSPAMRLRADRCTIAAGRAFERVGVFGPPGGMRDFENMKSLRHERPYANELVGAHSTGPVTGGADWVCSLPEHWIYAGTEMRAGDRIPGLIGWEWHGDPATIPGLEIVATSPHAIGAGHAQRRRNTRPRSIQARSRISCSTPRTCWWADGMSDPPGYVRPSVYTAPLGPDPRVQRMTANILERMRSGTA